MGEFFDYLMRRKPLLLLFLAAFLSSGIFSYHVFIQSQTVLDRHAGDTIIADNESDADAVAPHTEPITERIETPVAAEAPADETPAENLETESVADEQQSEAESAAHGTQYTEAPGFFTKVQDAYATALMTYPSVTGMEAETETETEPEPESEIIAEIEVPHTGELDESSLSHGANLEAEDTGYAQENTDLAVPRTGQAEASNSHPLLTAVVVLAALATVLLGAYTVAMHFLR